MNVAFCCFCFNEFKNKVLGNEAHTILSSRFSRFSDVGQSFMSRFEKLVPNIKDLSDTDRLLYILTCEGESTRLVSCFSGFIWAEIQFC